MAITEVNKIDGMAVDKHTLVLLMTDALDWNQFEREHLEFIRKKLNNYIAFIQTGGYKIHYPQRVFEKFRIELVFKYPYTAVALSFLSSAALQMQTQTVGIELDYRVNKNK